jgi:two-component system, chemotaxis family, response regulator Rcp1
MVTVHFPEKAIKILLVEDNRSDVVLMRRLLEKCRFPVDLQVVRDGEEALASLRKSAGFDGKEDPDLVLLDLGLPKIDGHQVLEAIKNSPGLKHLPVFILSSSNADQDVATAFQNKASLYIVKPMDLDQFNTVVEKIEKFWLEEGP